jgi:hypothetical protein
MRGLFVLALVVLASVVLVVSGCDFLAPVVTTFPASSRFAGTCDEPPTCDGLAHPPPPIASLASLLGPDDACGAGGRQARSLIVTEDTFVQAEDLLCADLTIEIEGAGEGVRVLTLGGDALTRARVHVHSAAMLVELQVDVRIVEATELSVDGPITITLGEVQTVASRILLESAAPLAPAQLQLDLGSLNDVAIAGPRGVVRLQSAYGHRATFAVDSLVLERGRLEEVSIDARLLEMIDAELRAADVAVDRLVAASGLFHTVHLSRCGSVSLSDLSFVRSFIARCDEPLDVRYVAIEECGVLADVAGRGGGIRGSAFGGAHVTLDTGDITNSAICGTRSIDVSAIDCVRCDPGAPPDVCAVAAADETFCPGLCGSVCSISGEPTLPPEVCSP